MASQDRIIEVHAASDILKYLDDQKKIMLRNQQVLSETADLLEQAMTASAPYERPIARKKARKVASYMRAAADDAKAQAVKMVRMKKQFLVEYSDLIEPKRTKRQQIDWTR